jgi:predicted MPP superfamily phosphohydrolase
MIAWLIVLGAVLGHISLHLAIYNRLNGTGFRRRTIKRVEKLFFASFLVIPIFFAAWWWDEPSPVNTLGDRLRTLSWLTQAYGVLCIASLLGFGIPWLMWRPIFGLEWTSAPRRVSVINVAAEVERPLPLSTKCRWESKIPFNQIFDLAIEEIDLPVPGLDPSLDGLRIAHLSDLHFTGDISPEYAKFVVTKANEWQPELSVITGDIIDKQRCIEWLFPIFSGATATYGKFFILGNHDTRVSDPSEVRREMARSGWTDVGGGIESVTVRNQTVEILGNEKPWFSRPQLDHQEPSRAPVFRILLSHSPDQIWWARRHRIPLMLAGHTHGGQGRVPLVGPLLSPSFHGSRFASGDFYKAPTTMHVSRGLGGVHLLRWNCRPELSLLILRSVDVSPSRQ